MMYLFFCFIFCKYSCRIKFIRRLVGTGIVVGLNVVESGLGVNVVEGLGV